MITQQSRRLGFIDSARGIAALIVLIQHSLEAAGLTNVYTGFGYQWLNLGQAGVVTFFIISGFVIPLGIEKWNSVRHFAIGRAARIYPLYLFILAINLALLNSGNFLNAPIENKIQTITEHLFFLQEYISKKNYVGASWTLSVEAVWYIMFGTLIAMNANKRHRTITYVPAAILFGLAAVSILKNSRIPLGRIDLILLCIGGLILYRHNTKTISTRLLLELLAVITFAITIGQWTAFSYFSHPELSSTAILFSWLFGIGIFAFFYLLRDTSIANNSTLIRLGGYSYSIYLTHPLIIDLISFWHVRGWQMFFITCTTTLLLSTFTFKFIESPAINWAANLRRSSLSLSR